MPVNIHGKEYVTVAERVAKFRESDIAASISTEILKDGDRVLVKAVITTSDGNEATGYAEEERDSSNINKTSAIENAETSAVGRALAFLGYAGTEIASADEVANALKQQVEKRIWEEWAAHTAAVERNRESLENIRDRLADDDFEAARESWNSISHDDQMILWRATTKGGWFTTRERQQMKWWSNDFETQRGSTE